MAFIMILALGLPLLARTPVYRDYSNTLNRNLQNNYNTREAQERRKRIEEQRRAESERKDRERQTVLGIFAAGGIAGSVSSVVYDPTLPNQTVEYEIALSYSYGIFINLYHGWITEFSYNCHEVKHTWYDDHGRIEYSIPITTYGLTTGYQLTWPGFYAINRGSGFYPFIMAGLGAHIAIPQPEVERKMNLRSSADELDLDVYYGNRYRVKMKQLQGSLTGSIGSEYVLSRNFSIGIGIRGTYYLYLYENSNVEKIKPLPPGDGEPARDYGDFSIVTPVTIQAFVTVSFMY